jgi:hypothetical protein
MAVSNPSRWASPFLASRICVLPAAYRARARKTRVNGREEVRDVYPNKIWFFILVQHQSPGFPRFWVGEQSRRTSEDGTGTLRCLGLSVTLKRVPRWQEAGCAVERPSYKQHPDCNHGHCIAWHAWLWRARKAQNACPGQSKADNKVALQTLFFPATSAITL